MKKLDVKNMDYLAGISFGYDLKREDYYKEAPLRSLELMKEETGANTVVVAFHALQEEPQSVVIDFIGEETPTKEGLKRIVDKARELDLYVILKPMLDCRNGTWRGHINFFDKDVPCEPKWGDWFQAYTEYQVHFAKIAQELGVDMLCIACEMVQTQRRDADWRKCIAEIRKHYQGPLTWNCDKYQEDEVTFWDALDVISASGYYPIDHWEEQLDRIQAVVEKYQKPFFFIECGCMTCRTSPPVPNSWIRFHDELVVTAKALGVEFKAVTRPSELSAEARANIPSGIKQVYESVVDFESQANFFKAVFSACEKRSFVRGFGLWDWEGKLQYDQETIGYDGGYGMYLKPSSTVVKEFFTKKIR